MRDFEQMCSSGPYDRMFYDTFSPGSSSSARIVVPFLISALRPASVVDVGCGIGTWAAEFMQSGVTDLLGIDGAWVDRTQLKIPTASFLERDLETPIRLERTFDLAVSMEVAEHLSPTHASSFVEDLTRLAPVVLFSAAIPNQGGTDHLNEQWASYWASLFAEHRFQVLDCLRARFWNDARIEPWYRQNMLLYVREDRLLEFPHLGQPGPLDIVHPHFFRKHAQSYQGTAIRPSLGFLLRSFPGALRRSLRLKPPK